MADGGFVGTEELCGVRVGREDAGSFDDIANAAADTHPEAFGWVLGVLADRGLVKASGFAKFQRLTPQTVMAATEDCSRGS